jgi:hypothetical protein
MTQPPLLRLAFDSAGAQIVGQFGPERGDLDPRRPMLQTLSPAARQGRFWSGDRGSSQRYRMTQWDANGTAVRSLERKPDWFVNVEPPGPLPGLSALTEEADGTLWAFVSVRAPTWREAMPPPPPGVTGAYEVAARQIAFEKMYRSTIEAIDPANGRVLAHLEHNEWVFTALPGNRAAIYTVDDDGIARVKIVELTLTRR